MLRVERFSSGAPMRASSASTSRVTDEVATFSCRAAAEKPPLLATRQKAFSSANLSIVLRPAQRCT
jgi:hypothetical protein